MLKKAVIKQLLVHITAEPKRP